MKDNIFCLAGKVNVPAEKKNEMNRHVLEILDKCGIRKTVEMTVAGKKVTAVISARPDAEGIVLFDYSIFEKKKRKISKYDLNTCELYVEDQGYNEFGIVMNMIMVLQEAYTNVGCYFTKSGKLYDIEIYLFLIQGVLGEKINIPGRIRMWDMYLFFRNSEEYKNVTYRDLLEGYSKDYGELDTEQLLAVLEIENKELMIPGEKRIFCRNEINSANSCSRIEYAYRVFGGMKAIEKAGMKSFLAELLNADFAKRKELSARQDEKGIIAELARQFRNALDAAWEDDMFRNLYPFDNFPNDCCGHTCDLLSQFLLEHGIETRQVNRTCRKDSQWHHVWLKTENGTVIDITGDQFIGRLVIAKEVEAVHVGEEGIVHKIFCVNRVSKITIIFTDQNEYTDFGGRPSVYQQRLIDVYEIVRSYL